MVKDIGGCMFILEFFITVIGKMIFPDNFFTVEKCLTQEEVLEDLGTYPELLGGCYA